VPFQFFLVSAAGLGSFGILQPKPKPYCSKRQGWIPFPYGLLYIFQAELLGDVYLNRTMLYQLPDTFGVEYPESRSASALHMLPFATKIEVADLCLVIAIRLG
jgi:hypothetical protein